MTDKRVVEVEQIASFENTDEPLPTREEVLDLIRMRFVTFDTIIKYDDGSEEEVWA